MARVRCHLHTPSCPVKVSSVSPSVFNTRPETLYEIHSVTFFFSRESSFTIDDSEFV